MLNLTNEQLLAQAMALSTGNVSGGSDAGQTEGPPAPAPRTAMPAYVKGDNAYQIALNNGFVGTEAQWLASLHAPSSTPAGPLVRYANNRLEYFDGNVWVAIPGVPTGGSGGGTTTPPTGGGTAASVFPLPVPFILA